MWLCWEEPWACAVHLYDALGGRLKACMLCLGLGETGLEQSMLLIVDLARISHEEGSMRKEEAA